MITPVYYMDTKPLERVGGLVERVTFHNDESGFCVLRIKAKGHRDLVTVIGTLPQVRAGEWLEAEGWWTIDRDHGQQFKAQVLRTTSPDTVEGMEKYLGSGLIKGIGPGFASRLVKHFGEKVLEIIDTNPQRLTEVDGIGPVRFQKITTAWQEQQKIRKIMVFLHSHGVSTSRAFRIYKTYGDEAIEKVAADPYCLCRDIHGIGFKTADKIAASLGIGNQSDIRARAGVEYVLQEFTKDGHCGNRRENLITSAVKMLEMPQTIVETAVDYSIQQQRLVEHKQQNESSIIYLSSIDHAENKLAIIIKNLCQGTHPCPTIDIEKALSWVEQKVNLTLAPQQQQAVTMAANHKVMIITGGPGVGKTTVINSIVKIMHAKKLSVVLSAPTGRAAKRMFESTGLSAKTIHRLLEFDPANMDFKHNALNPLNGDLFIVDEVSMLDVILAYRLMQAIPSHAALILVGDVDQLPSVGPGCVLRDLIDSGVIPVCRLNEVFRQAAQSDIIVNAHRVNNGELPLRKNVGDDDSVKTDFYFIEAQDPEKAVDLIRRLVSEAIPARFGFDKFNDIQVLTPMQRGTLGSRGLNVVLQEALNPSGQSICRYGWTFRTGDKVMQTVNNYDKDVFNGDIGRITEIDEIEQEVVVQFDDRNVTYDYNELDELVLSYATTVHKSQGSEYPVVVMPIHMQHYMLLQRNLLYTAITRGRKLVVMVGLWKAVAIAVKKLSSISRVTLLKERLLNGSTSKV